MSEDSTLCTELVTVDNVTKSCGKIALHNYNFCAFHLKQARQIALEELEKSFRAQRKAWEKWKELNK